MPVQAPLLTAGDRSEPVICTYWFGQSWEPWRTNDRADEEAFDEIARLKINTLLVHHEPSQSLEKNWRWLDRDHRLAKAKGLFILPFLERGAGADMAAHAGAVGQRLGLTVPLGLTQGGQPRQTLIWSDAAQAALTAYAKLYLQRYLDQGSILRLMWHGRPRPVVCLSAESGWDSVSFDPETNALFRAWLQRKYAGNVAGLNAEWGTQYPDFEAVDPRNPFIFSYGQLKSSSTSPADEVAVPPPVRDHARFRAELVSQALSRVASQLRAQYPDLLFCAEVPFSFACPRPEAVAFRWSAAMLPEIVDYADIVIIRSAGKLWPADWPVLQALTRSGKQMILVHRIGRPLSGRRDAGPMLPDIYAETCIPAEAAAYANGLGWYSWNDLDGDHVVDHRDTPQLLSFIETADGSYRGLVAGTKPTVDLQSAWDVLGPTNANIIDFGGTPEIRVLPFWVTQDLVSDANTGQDETGTYCEAQPPKRGDAWSAGLADVAFDEMPPGLDVRVQLRVGGKQEPQVGIRFLDSDGVNVLWSESANCGRRVAYVEWVLPLSRISDKRGHLQLAPLHGMVRVYDMRLWMASPG
jgi:hypothetical protein